MAIKESSVISVGYPILATKFINNKTILVIGGGGEGNNGVPNKITAIKCSFKVTDKSRILQRFREITLPSNEDSPQCVDIIRTTEADEKSYGVFVGCNQSSQLMLSMGINNNLRKYSFTQEEHLRFLDAAQMEPATHGIDDFPKVVRLSPRGTVGCLMTSTVPSSIYVFNPDSLDLIHKFKPVPDQEIKDFVLDSSDDGEGNVLAYVTSKSIETVLTKTGQSLFSSSKSKTKGQLDKYTLSKVRFTQTGQELIIAGTNKKDKTAVLILYSLKLGKILKVSRVSKKFGVVGAMEISTSANLIAVAGNNLSVVLLRLSDLKVIETFEQLHPFAITDVSFSPNGHKLASVSAAQTLHVMKIPPNYAKGKSTIGTVFGYLFTIIFMALAAIFIQAAYESGEFDDLIVLSKQYGAEWGKLSKDFSLEVSKEWWARSKQLSEVGMVYANDYGHKGWEMAQVYGKVGYQYSKKGLALADEYAHKGIDIIKEKIKKDKVSDADADTDFFKVDDWDAKTHELTGEDDTYMKVETQTPSSKEIEQVDDFKYETSFSDYVSIETQTKNIDEYTKDNQSVDTESLLSNPDIYETKIVAASSKVVYTSIETVETSEATASSVKSIKPLSSKVSSVKSVEYEESVDSEDPIESVVYEESIVSEEPIESVVYEESIVSEKPMESVVYEESIVSEDPIESVVYEESIVSEKPMESVVYEESIVSEDPIESEVYEESIDPEVSIETVVEEESTISREAKDTVSDDSPASASSQTLSSVEVSGVSSISTRETAIEEYPDLNEPVDVDTKVEQEVEDFPKRKSVKRVIETENLSESELEAQDTESQLQKSLKPVEEESLPESPADPIEVNSESSQFSDSIGHVADEASTEAIYTSLTSSSTQELESSSSETVADELSSVLEKTSLKSPEVSDAKTDILESTTLSAETEIPVPVEESSVESIPDTEVEAEVEADIKPKSEVSTGKLSASVGEPQPYIYTPPSEETAEEVSNESIGSKSLSEAKPESKASESSVEPVSAEEEIESQTSSVPPQSTLPSASQKSSSLTSEEEFKREYTPSFPPPQRSESSSVKDSASAPPPVSSEESQTPTPSVEYDSLTVVETVVETETNAAGQRQIIHKVITRIRKYPRPALTQQVVHDEL